MQIRKIKSNIKTLETWVHKRNWTINFKAYSTDKMSTDDKEISINSKLSLETQLYTLLHECGHILARAKLKQYYKRYPSTHRVEIKKFNKGLMRAKAYKIDALSEEIDAWRSGKQLAKRLKIQINEKNFNTIMYKSVFTYVEAYAE